MRPNGFLAATILLLVACGSRDEGSAPVSTVENGVSAPTNPANVAGQTVETARWDLQASGEGAALVLLSAAGGPDLRIFCPSGANSLLVNVPGFRPIGSEERLSFGGGGEVVALVADPRGDPQRGGVSGTGDVPRNLAALLAGRVSASYGAQNSGPHPAPPPDLSRAFVRACHEKLTAAPGPQTPPPAPSGAGPCLVQDGTRLDRGPLRAIGTEPFWGARIEGRCVTYTHPDDQHGTRIWTRFTAIPNGGLWAGALGGRRFELRARAAPGCSDGMSDRSYPMAVELFVEGERRTGCAEPL